MTKPLTEKCHRCGETIYNIGLRNALDDEAEQMYGHLPETQTVALCEPCYVEFRAWRDSPDGLVESIARKVLH